MNGSFNAWKLVSLSPLPLWAVVLLCVGLLAGIGLAAWGVRREPARWKRYLLWTLRVGAGLAAAFFLLEPGVRQLQVASVKNRVAVLVDRSASMSFPAESGGDSRAVVVADYLSSVSAQLDALKDRFNVELYGFDPELSPATPQTLKTEPPRGGRTDLMAALRSIKAGEQGGATKKLSGVLLFSDGADNAELQGGLNSRAREALEDFEVPVSTFLVGNAALKDLAIENVKVDDFAFVRNSITVEVEIRGRGFAGADVPVILSREGSAVANKTVRLRSADDVQVVPFTFTPDQTGRFVYTVSMPVFPGEVVTDNNSRAFVLKVIRDRIRVLFVVGRPSWDERFMRGLLRQDANIDLISFYILRTLGDQPTSGFGSEERELSLIPFPTDEIFDEKLHTFDVVILQNFGYTEPGLSLERYEQNLADYVKNGGAILYIGGDRVLGEGRASLRSLAEALPVEPVGTPANLELFRPRLTPEGLRHPVTALATGNLGTEAVWASLPNLPGANVVRSRPGATVLLDHPFQTVQGQNAPILALWDHGRGRSMALMVDSSWYWAFTAHASGAPTRHYDKFFGNALRWLVRDPELTTITLTADPPSVEPGKPVAGIVSARTPDYQPANGAQVRVELISVETQKVIGTQTGTTTSDGVVRVEFPPPDPGAYKLKATAKLETKELGTAEDAVAVRAVGPELSDASARADVLEEIAKRTGGKFFKLPQSGLPEIPFLDPPLVEVGRSKDQPLWDRWYYLVALVALLGVEWLLRRRFGYV